MNLLLKQTLAFFFPSLLSITILQAQTILVLKPDASKGKDAYIEDIRNTQNWSDHTDIPAISTTNGGRPANARGLIEFDLSTIPADAIIHSAKLSLYSHESPKNGTHTTRSGSNEAILRRVTSPWDENTVTWASQPSTTSVNEVTLPATQYDIQHFPDIDVTDLIRDMINNPQNSHGFMMKLKTEEYYRKMIFASSDHPDASLHPKLEIAYSEPSHIDSCVLLKPGALSGKDAYIEHRRHTQNWGDRYDLAAIATTFKGTPSNVRGLIEFDLGLIPDDAVIESALLSLYSHESTDNGTHTTRSGSNETVLRRIIQPWNEDDVTWNTQPLNTPENEVYLKASRQDIQHYPNINVTELVKDMKDDPDNSFGFMLQLRTEEYYRKMIFASSDHADASLHPELEVCYAIPLRSSDEGQNLNIDVYPNPTSDYVTIKCHEKSSAPASIEVWNLHGHLLKSIKNATQDHRIDFSDQPSGMYLLRIQIDDSFMIEKIVVE